MRLLRGEYARLDLQEALSLWWGRWGGKKVCMVAVQIEGGAERAGWFGWARIPDHLLHPHLPLLQMFSSQQTFTEHLLCPRYVVGAWGRGGGERG